MIDVSQNVWDGVISLLDDYVGVRDSDSVAILYTGDSLECAAWVSSMLQVRGIKHERVWMAPLLDDEFPSRLGEVLARFAPNETERLVVLSFERDTMSHTTALNQAIENYADNRLVFRAISACEELFAHALSVSPRRLSALNTSLLGQLMPAKKLRITTDGGSDFEVGLDAKHRWISNRGIAKPKRTVILPAGEVATFPAWVEGTFVADYAFNVNAITKNDSRLVDHPVTIQIKEGRAVDYRCDDPIVTKFLQDCFSTHCAYNVGEIGFGTNGALQQPILMNSHINERRLGVHLGFGQHNQVPSVVGYQCAIHLDLIARGGLVWVDDSSEPIDLEDISPSEAAHPKRTRDEDVFAPGTEEIEIDDCCGVLTSEGLNLFRMPESQ